MTRPAARRADADQAGFTLLELLAVLMVLGLVMMAVGGGVRFASRGFDRAAATATELSSYSLAADVLRRRGERLFPLSVGWGADSQFVFLGEVDRLAGPILSAPAESPAGSPAPGPPLRYALFQIEALEGGGSRLIHREHRLVTDPGLRVIEPADHAVNLYESAAAMRFSYHDGARWLDRWAAPRDLPRLIRLSFTDASGRATRPALILRPRLDGDRGCAIDAALPCRDRP
jgi:prepilin-type N-terminal cleavage/methylation domain-containing protein